MEVVLATVPAVVDQLTMDFRLRTILFRDLALAAGIGQAPRDFFAPGSSLEQAAALVLKRRQFAVAEE